MPTEQDLMRIAAQLRCPDGDGGRAMGEHMHDTNAGMTRQTLGGMSFHENSQILELGFGNAKHVPDLYDGIGRQNVQYFGLDISQTMVSEARKNTSHLKETHDVLFERYDGLHLPYADGLFDIIFSVNTIYFWEDPALTMTELGRVASCSARLHLTFADPDFMQTLPFTAYGFTLYHPDNVHALAKAAGWELVNCMPYSEQITSKAGDLVTRIYYVATYTILPPI